MKEPARVMVLPHKTTTLRFKSKAGVAQYVASLLDSAVYILTITIRQGGSEDSYAFDVTIDYLDKDSNQAGSIDKPLNILKKTESKYHGF